MAARFEGLIYIDIRFQFGIGRVFNIVDFNPENVCCQEQVQGFHLIVDYGFIFYMSSLADAGFSCAALGGSAYGLLGHCISCAICKTVGSLFMPGSEALSGPCASVF